MCNRCEPEAHINWAEDSHRLGRLYVLKPRSVRIRLTIDKHRIHSVR